MGRFLGHSVVVFIFCKQLNKIRTVTTMQQPTQTVLSKLTSIKLDDTSYVKQIRLLWAVKKSKIKIKF